MPPPINADKIKSWEREHSQGWPRRVQHRGEQIPAGSVDQLRIPVPSSVVPAEVVQGEELVLRILQNILLNVREER